MLIYAPPAAGGNDFPPDPLISNPLTHQLRGWEIIPPPGEFEGMKLPQKE
jgi:hypothetical protein